MPVTVRWLAVKTTSEMAYTVSGGALNSTQSNPVDATADDLQHDAKPSGCWCWRVEHLWKQFSAKFHGDLLLVFSIRWVGCSLQLPICMLVNFCHIVEEKCQNCGRGKMLTGQNDTFALLFVLRILGHFYRCPCGVGAHVYSEWNDIMPSIAM